jgi:hypothetical protein
VDAPVTRLIHQLGDGHFTFQAVPFAATVLVAWYRELTIHIDIV